MVTFKVTFCDNSSYSRTIQNALHVQTVQVPVLLVSDLVLERVCFLELANCYHHTLSNRERIVSKMLNLMDFHTNLAANLSLPSGQLSKQNSNNS